MALDLDRWWRVMRLHLEPTDGEPVLSPAALEDALRARFAAHSPALADRLALPPQFVRYLEVLGLRAWRGEEIDLDFVLFGSDGVLASVEYALQVHGAGPDSLWLQIAAARDHTSMFLCCDRARPEHGMFGVDCDDFHPWSDGADVLAPFVPLETWLCGLVRDFIDQPTTALVALEPGELERIERIAAHGDRSGTTYLARDLAALPPSSARVLVIDPALALVIESSGSRNIYEGDDLQLSLLAPEQTGEVLAELERRGTEQRVLAWNEPRHQLWPGGLADAKEFLQRAAEGHRTVLVVLDGWAPYEPDPDPAGALVDRLKRPGPVPTSDPDPFAIAWAFGQDLRAMIELLQIAASRGIYKIGMMKMTASSYDTRWQFHLRTPHGDATLVDVARGLGPRALRAIVPTIAPQETWIAATLAMHDAFVDPIAQLVFALDELGGPTAAWRERWSADDSLAAAWDASHTSIAMRQLLERAGRMDLVALANDEIERVPPPQLPPDHEDAPWRVSAEQERVFTAAIRRAVPTPPTLAAVLAGRPA